MRDDGMLDRGSLQERLERSIDRRPGQGPAGDCWESRLTPSQVYPMIREGARGSRSLKANRVALEIKLGRPLGALNACHACDNRRCVRPSHLWAGTQQQNIADAVAKGRMLKGEEVITAKLTKADVLEIRRLGTTAARQRDIAEMYGVHQSVISRVLTRKTWKHVGEDS